MRQIDKLVAHLVRFAADALIAASNAPVVIRTATGDRTSSQVLDHAAIVGMVQEVAPIACQADLQQSKVVRFGYTGSPSGPVTVEVVPGAMWKVTLRPGLDAGIPRSPAGAPAPTGAPQGNSGAPLASSGAPQAPATSQSPASGGELAIERLLRQMTHKNASDLHLSCGAAPMVRLHGEMQRLDDNAAPLTHDGLKALLWPIMPKRTREEWERRHDTDWAHEIVNVSRFRCNAFMDRNGIGAVFRRIPYEIIPAEKLGLTAEMLELCQLSKGLVLVTGPTGSGKSTTLAAMVDRVNATRDDHIITIEDPIEFVHTEKKCLIHQREVKVHTDGFRVALRAALREDPDIVLVGEMRDLETVEIAIETAETGHLVFGTLHTNTAPSTVDRIIDQFPADRQSQIRTMLSESLKGVIAQTLCKKIGGGRVAAYEVLLGTTAVANMIREGKTYQLHGYLQTSRGLGMITMGESLTDLVIRGLVEPREAYLKAVNKTEIKQLFSNAGIALPEN